ncbi:MAG: glycosyltransferase [Methylococcales bacterium]|nr:MAG: glycosyltransferase [Methylococcales bacterium]
MSHSRRVRIAYCIDSFDIGGTELNAVRTAEALDPERFELCVAHLQADGPLRERYEKLGVHMVHFPIPNLYSPQTVRQGVRFARFLRDWDADISHTHDIYSNIFYVPWARLTGKCRVIAGRRWWYDAPRPGLIPLNRWSYRLAHRILANSGEVAKLLAREEGVSLDKIVEIPNFLAKTAFDRLDEASRIAQRRAWGVPDGAFAIGIVARLAPVKNHALLLLAVEQLAPRFHLVLVGDGPSRSELSKLAHQLNIEHRVHFAGEVISPLNLHQFFDASVLCSLNEGFPNSVIEALAAARPVVATAVGGVIDVVTDGVTGILVSLGDPARLAGALQLLEADPLLCIRLGESGREAVREKFHQDIVIGELSTLYEALADNRE